MRCGIIGKFQIEDRLNKTGADKKRITIHNASWDYEGSQPRHGTRVTALAEKPVFDADAPTRRQGLGLLGPEEIKELEVLSGLTLK